MHSDTITLTPLRESFGVAVEAARPAPIQTLSRDLVASLFRRHGALLFRNFGADADAFTEFSAAHCHSFSTYQGGGFRWGKLDRQKVNNNDTLLTVTGATQSFGIPLHGEMYYMKQRPTVLWFFCENPPATAGETILCSGAEFYSRMGEDEREFFARNRLKYVRHLTAEEWPVAFQHDDAAVLRRWCDDNDCELTESADGSVTIEYVCPAVRPGPAGEEVFINTLLLLHSVEQAIRSGYAAQVIELPRNACPIYVRLESGEEIPAALVERLKQAAEVMTVKVRWKKGDVLMIDNRRVMHGRKNCQGADRKIFVRMGEPAFDC